jgi:hypothetical protein
MYVLVEFIIVKRMISCRHNQKERESVNGKGGGWGERALPTLTEMTRV